MIRELDGHGGRPGAVRDPDTPSPFWPLEEGGGGGWDQKHQPPGLSLEGGIFNEPQTTFVPICRCGHKIRSGCTHPALLGTQGKCRQKTERFEYKHMGSPVLPATLNGAPKFAGACGAGQFLYIGLYDGRDLSNILAPQRGGGSGTAPGQPPPPPPCGWPCWMLGVGREGVQGCPAMPGNAKGEAGVRRDVGHRHARMRTSHHVGTPLRTGAAKMKTAALPCPVPCGTFRPECTPTMFKKLHLGNGNGIHPTKLPLGAQL